MRYGEAGQSHLLPFLGAAALFAALTIMAHSVVLGLAAVIAGPVPAAQTALSLSRKAVSGAAQEEAASVAEAAPESTGTAASQPEAAAPTGGIESYLVEPSTAPCSRGSASPSSAGWWDKTRPSIILYG